MSTNDISEPISLTPVVETQSVVTDPVPVETRANTSQPADPPMASTSQPDLPINNILDPEAVGPEVAPIE